MNITIELLLHKIQLLNASLQIPQIVIIMNNLYCCILFLGVSATQLPPLLTTAARVLCRLGVNKCFFFGHFLKQLILSLLFRGQSQFAKLGSTNPLCQPQISYFPICMSSSAPIPSFRKFISSCKWQGCFHSLSIQPLDNLRCRNIQYNPSTFKHIIS